MFDNPDTLLGTETMVENIHYKSLNYHWFYSSHSADRITWIALSYKDSENLERTYKQNM